MDHRAAAYKSAINQAVLKLSQIFPGSTLEDTPTEMVIRIPKPKEHPGQGKLISE